MKRFQFLLLTALLTACGQPKKSDDVVFYKLSQPHCLHQNGDWSDQIDISGPEMPLLNLDLTRTGLSLRSGSSIDGMNIEQTLGAAKEFNPKPILILHIEKSTACRMVDATMQSISQQYDCDRRRCVIKLEP